MFGLQIVDEYVCMQHLIDSYIMWLFEVYNSLPLLNRNEYQRYSQIRVQARRNSQLEECLQRVKFAAGKCYTGPEGKS
jgi:hypothetical protein